ncbi:hypothetical protein ACIPSE_01850 [Streptomyces sp. NPDC090106]|uniref:hypothetical protein n=1 Tax=Streptomyces sp. NPDC090106 TaxID=3365946 RepID=UPI003811F585
MTRTRSLDCPTCQGMQLFRLLNREEKAAVRAERGERLPVDNLWRCTAEGCLTYYPHLRKTRGLLLPERFRLTAGETGGTEGGGGTAGA